MSTLRLSILGAFFSGIMIAQTFSSGSNGANGALDLTSADQSIQLPPSGILNYTTVNIPAGRTLSFINNLRTTPVVILAQGAVNISGFINVSASGFVPGPGGFYGGAPGQMGLGPAGGQPSGGNPPRDGIWLGPLSLVPNIGGSGGGGTSGCGGTRYGGGGGGAITVASSTSITVSGGAILANGDFGGSEGGNGCFVTGSNGGPGAIRLVANTVNVSGVLNAAVVRLEAPLNAVSYSGSGQPPVISTINPTIIPTNPPAISIVSIGGYPVPSYSGSSLSTIDLLLPTALQDPIPVVIQGNNVPVGSPVTMSFSGSGGATSTTTNLVGTTASSTATVYVSGLNRGGGYVTFLFASTSFNANLLAGNLQTNDPNGLAKIELAAAPGAKTRYRFLRADGMDVDMSKLPPGIRWLFGL